MQKPYVNEEKYDKRRLKNIFSILSFPEFKQNVWLKQNHSLLIKFIFFLQIFVFELN